MAEIILAKSAGFCFGVGRAVEMALSAEKPLYCIGALVHNNHVLETMHSHGVITVSSPEEVPYDASVIIRSHGADKSVYEKLAGRKIIDATCPCVKKIHDIVSEESANGYHIFIFGDRNHPEVSATVGLCKEYMTFVSLEELENLFAGHPGYVNKPICVVAQTTGEKELFEKCGLFLKKVCTNLKILDTICSATAVRQREARELSRITDAMIVVGDMQSANTKGLASVCEKAKYLVQSAEDLPLVELSQFNRIGVTAGASTPAEIIKEVLRKMEEMKNADRATAAETGDTFADLLESSLKTLYTGDRVTGVVTSKSATELTVDLGTKHAGYIPFDELSDDPEEKNADNINIGDEIEVFVVRVNDVEGTAMLSKKRLETVKTWAAVETARESGAILEGVVVEENKGGIVVSVKGVRVFVPGSQTGLPKDAAMSELMKTKVKLRITEFNRARRRVVGTIRAVSQDEKRIAAANLWETIEIGNKYKGKVKSLTSFGAFIDIGGVDGMVHVSELSWERIKQPSDFLKIGDELDVYVINFDKEKKKISLGHRLAAENPWNRFISSYNIGDVFDVTVVKLMPFGAFCSIIPGVDGLIHISQLSDRRVMKPADVVSEGQKVTVKLTDIDMVKKKISLSIRALMEEGDSADIPEANEAEAESGVNPETSVETGE